MPIHDVQANPGQVLPDTRPADLTAEETEAAADQETREEQEEPEPAADSDLAATDLEAAANTAPDPVTSDPAPDPEPQPDPAADLADDPEPQPEEQYAWHCNRCGLGFHNYDKKTRDEVRGGTRGVRQQTPLFRCRKCNSLRTSMKNDGSYYDVMTLSAENAQKYFLEARAMTPAEKQHFIAQHSVTNYEGKESKKRKRSEPQPLSVWKSRGYPVAQILQNTLPEDIEEHPVLGTLYRLHLRVKDDIECNGWKAENQMLDPTESASADSRASTGSLIKSPEDRSNALVQQSKTAISICAHKLCKQMQTFI